jgi:micrococcal nuclease
VLTALAVLVLVALRAWSEREAFDPPAAQDTRRADGRLEPGEYRVLRVVDGDTLLLEYARTRVRLQGIDTPETVKEDTPVEDWGPEATQYTRRFVQDAAGRVRIEIDGETVDRYGRQLVFVWHEDRLLNEELVRQGLARAKLAFDYSEAKKQRMRAAQTEAEAEGRGIWKH